MNVSMPSRTRPIEARIVVRQFRALAEALGRLDIFVNNAGVASAGVFEAFTPKQAVTLFDLNIIGFPIKVRVPAKLDFKNPKHVVQITVTNDLIPGFRAWQGYNWFSGLRAEFVPVQAGPLKCLNFLYSFRSAVAGSSPAAFRAG